MDYNLGLSPQQTLTHLPLPFFSGDAAREFSRLRPWFSERSIFPLCESGIREFHTNTYCSKSTFDIIEAGCGVGIFGKAFTKAALMFDPVRFRLWGYDVSEDMLKKAKENEVFFYKLCLHDADESAIPSSFPPFDIAVSCGVLHYLTEWKPFLHQLADRLEPGGKIWVFLREDPFARALCGLPSINECPDCEIKSLHLAENIFEESSRCNNGLPLKDQIFLSCNVEPIEKALSEIGILRVRKESLKTSWSTSRYEVCRSLESGHFGVPCSLLSPEMFVEVSQGVLARGVSEIFEVAIWISLYIFEKPSA